MDGWMDHLPKQHRRVTILNLMVATRTLDYVVSISRVSAMWRTSVAFGSNLVTVSFNVKLVVPQMSHRAPPGEQDSIFRSCSILIRVAMDGAY